MHNPKPLPPMVYVEIEVSYRWQGSEPACAYVAVIEQRNATHRRIVDTRHIQSTGDTLRLVDEVAGVVREWTMEYVVPEPF